MIEECYDCQRESSLIQQCNDYEKVNEDNQDFIVLFGPGQCVTLIGLFVCYV